MHYTRPKFFEMMRYANQAEGDVIDMVSGNPDFEPPAALREAIRAYADVEQGRYQYPPSDGLLELRQEIADRWGVDVEQVVVTNGAGGANYLGMAIGLDRDVGETAVLTDPVYPYYPGKVEMLGGTVRYVPTLESGQLDADAMIDAIGSETGLVVLNSPNNPTGAVYDLADVRAVIEQAETHDAVVVVDEVYDRFDYSDRFESALAIDSDHRIVTGGFSKSMAITGFRVGFAILPHRFVEAAVTRNMLTNVAGSRPAQHAVLEALRTTPEAYYEAARDTLHERIEAFTEALDRVGAGYTTPQGSFYVLARFEGVPGTTANAKRLVDAVGVAGMPGATFGETYDDWLRFAVVTPRAIEAAERLGAYFSD